MRLAWYAHRQELSQRPWWIAALVSWGVALFEYRLEVPADRIGGTLRSMPPLTIPQEVITPAAFMPVALPYLTRGLELDCLWAGCCTIGTGDVRFRSQA